MYGYTGQNQYSNYAPGYTTSLANQTALYNNVQSQAAQSIGTIGASNPSSIYTGFSNGAAVATPSPSIYHQFSNAVPPYGQYGQTAAVQQQQQQKLSFPTATAAVVAPTAAAHYNTPYGTPSAATATLQYCPAVAAVQQQQQHQQLQAVASAANVAAATYGPNITRVTDSYSTYGPLASTGGTFTSLNDYSNIQNLRNAAAAAGVVNQSSSGPFVSGARLNAIQSVSSNNSPSIIGSTTSGVPPYAGLNALCANLLQPKSANIGHSTASWQTQKRSSTFGSSNTTNISITGASRGRGPFFQSKRTGHTGNRPIGEIQPQHYCEICKITCASDSAYKDHIEGQKHKKKEASQKGDGVTLSKSRVSFRCEVCNVTCTGKDTYESHIRGSKHSRTAALMKKMGKPCTESPTVLAPGEKSNHLPITTGNPIATVGGPPVPTRRIAASSSIGPSTNQGNYSIPHDLVLRNVAEITSDASDKKSAIEAALAAEKDVLPVGEAYVEEERDANGKLVQYNCKLCDCKFSDPNAKNIHIKGRKHRLQYKIKVNPDYMIEIKPNQMSREMRHVLTRKGRSNELSPLMAKMEIDYFSQRPFNPPQPLLSIPPPRWAHRADPMQRIETNEDIHVMAKHKEITPSETLLVAVEKFVSTAESALSAVSDILAKQSDENKSKTEESAGLKVEPEVKIEVKMEPQESNENLEMHNDEPKDRLLKGVMRVGILAKELMLNSDREVQLVLLCSQSPTESLLSKVAEQMAQYFQTRQETEDIVHEQNEDVEQIAVVERPEESAILLQSTKLEIICRIVLTSVVLRHGMEENDGAGGKTIVAPEDSLPRGPCLEALAESRRANWFQVKCMGLQSAAITLRILRDIRQRVTHWRVLNTWAMELFVEKVLTSCGKPLSPGDALRRIFEAISSGILFSCGPGLMDPCERDSRDVLAYLSGQERENITSIAQHALRLIEFNQIHRVLAIERIPDARPMNSDRKRQRDLTGGRDDGEVIDSKKDKKADEETLKDGGGEMNE